MRDPLKSNFSFIIILLICCCISFLASCDRNKLKDPTKVLNEFPKIQIVDSINIESDSVWINFYGTDQFELGYLIGYDFGSKKLRLFDKSGKFLNFIGSQGEAPDSYGDVGSFVHFSPDSIFVADYIKGILFLYNLKGQYIDSWNVNKYDTLNSFPDLYNNGNLNIFYNNENDLMVEYAGYSLKMNTLSTPLYYEEAKLLSSLKLEKEPQISHHIPFTDDSPYKKGEYMLSFYHPLVKRLDSENYLVLHGHDDRLFVYDGEKNLKKIINCQSINFPTAKGVSFDVIDKNFMEEQVKYNYKLNAINYLNIVVGKGKYNGMIFKQYQAPMGDSDQIPNNLNAIYLNYYKRDSYLQIYDDKYNKIYGDLLQPEILKTLIYVDKFGKLIFTANDKLSESNILYLAKLVTENK